LIWSPQAIKKQESIGKEYVDPLVSQYMRPKNGTNLIIITPSPFENLCQRNIGSKRYRKPLIVAEVGVNDINRKEAWLQQ